MKNIHLLLFYLLAASVCKAQAPTANFTAAQTAGCAPVVISFQDQSTGSPTSWQWNFGNGNTSTLQNPSTTYFTPGTYTITLTATNGSGANTLTRTGFITVYGKPSVSFLADDSNGCAPFSIRFTDGSTPAPGTVNTSWQWDFGNGTSSTAQNPTVLYTTPGNYTVNLKVTNDKGCFATFSKTAYIKLTGGLQLDFSSAGPDRCRTPFPVSFTNTSTGPGSLSYLWTFGDGNTSTQQSPTNTYSAPGAYSVSLAVTSSNGCTDTLRRTNFINIQNISTSFTGPDSICVLAPVSFANTSLPAAQSSAWNFGEGTTSVAPNQTKTFTTAGTYTVRLLNTYAYCTDSFSKAIRVLPRPVAGFTAPNTAQCKPPLTVNFGNNSTNAVSWLWNFGDGSTSTQQNPSHLYTGYGSFTVTLVVTNASGCNDTLVQPAYVQVQKPVIRFPTLPQLGCVPFTTTLSANINTLDNVTSYLWEFGDGGTSTLATPTHTYTAQGNYKVKLTVTTSTGCTETDSLNNAVVIGRVPTVDFSAVPNPVCTFGQVQFTAAFSEGNT
ncbi:MAG TPA: PKD domain-containing protein, partial [Flavisolibacter sp.]|nr:PKD domain-containing protein [Flavisolibacter sp.]